MLKDSESGEQSSKGSIGKVRGESGKYRPGLFERYSNGWIGSIKFRLL